MKRIKNRLLSIILILSFILPMFSFTNNVEASTAPVGQAWLTANGSNTGIDIHAVYDRTHLLISDYSYSYTRTSQRYLVFIPMNSEGGTYTITPDTRDPNNKYNPGAYSNFKSIFPENNSKRGRVSLYRYPYRFYGDYEPYFNPFITYSTYSIDEFSNMNGVLSAYYNHYATYGQWTELHYLNIQSLNENYPNYHDRVYDDDDIPFDERDDGFPPYNYYYPFDNSTGIHNFRPISQYYAIAITYNDRNVARLAKINTSWFQPPVDLYTVNGYIGNVSARSDSNYVFFESPQGTLRRINLDGSGLTTLQTNSNTSITPLKEVKKHGYVIYAKKDTTIQSHDNGHLIYRSDINGSREVLLIDPGTERNEYGWAKYPYFHQKIRLISDDYIYYVKDGKTFRQHIVNTGINQQIFNFEAKDLYTSDDETFFYIHPSYKNTIYKYTLNDPPELTLNTPLNSTESANYYVKEEGLSTINVSGSVRDINNDTVTVTATLGGVTKSTTIANTATAKTFNFTFDVFTDNISDGIHTLVVTATDPKGATAPNRTRTIIVKGRVRHDDYVLVDSSLYYKLLYQDEESDPKYQEQFRYSHNPNYFKNPIGVISDSNTWRNGLYNKLALPGHYKLTYRAKDNPKNVTSFDEFRMWSRESLSEINLYVHRKPIAIFKATANTSGTITVTDFDKSYDLDHQGEVNNGIIARQWQWKNVNSPTWTSSSNPPTYLAPGHDYIIALRVRDIDGIGGIGVWGDWTEINITTKSGALAPLNALFTLNPNIVSHSASKTITTANLSSGPITRYEWIIRKSGVQQGSVISTSVPTSAQLKAYGIGQYTLQLRVGDATRWSEPYTLPYEVINNPPIASFEAPEVVYRDTNISLINTTPVDLDGDTITYQWKLKQPNGTEYNISTVANPSFKIQNFINTYSINPISAISKNWEIKLIATDSKGAKSEYTRELEVVNNVPEAQINGNASVNQYTTHNYASNDTDGDTGDNPLTIFRWKHTKPDGSYETYTTKDITLTFNEHGNHTIEHYVIDRIGDKSNTASLNVNVIENKAPTMTITAPNGTITKPSIIPGDPLMEWTYTDPESDPQEKYSFDFYYADDDILVKSLTNSDSTGSIRKYQMPKDTFERFRVVKGVGRTYSKYKWSELSNVIYFIINDAPVPGFTLDKNIVVRGEEINVISTAYDPNEEQGDTITHKYYIKKLPDGAESLYTSLKDFTLSINTLTANRASDQYQIRQVVTDTLGISSEHMETITVVNQKPIVEITQPSSSNKSNPSSFSELKPTIQWSYKDLDGDSQKKYRVNIYQADTNNIVTSSGEISSSSSSWTSAIELVEGNLYSARVQVYDGYEWSELSERKYFEVFVVKISGYLEPNPAMAGDEIIFNIETEGYVDKIVIIVPDEIIVKDNVVGKFNRSGKYKYPLEFKVNGSVNKKNDKLKYITSVEVDKTLEKNGSRIRVPYTFTVRAYKGDKYKEIELKLDIKRSVLDLIKHGIKK